MGGSHCSARIGLDIDVPSGHNSYRLRHVGVIWAFVERWVRQIDGKIEDRVDGPDAYVWRVFYRDRVVNLVYDDFPNGISVEAVDADSNAVIEQLFAMVSAEAMPDGI